MAAPLRGERRSPSAANSLSRRRLTTPRCAFHPRLPILSAQPGIPLPCAWTAQQGQVPESPCPLPRASCGGYVVQRPRYGVPKGPKTTPPAAQCLETTQRPLLKSPPFDRSKTGAGSLSSSPCLSSPPPLCLAPGLGGSESKALSLPRNSLALLEMREPVSSHRPGVPRRSSRRKLRNA